MELSGQLHMRALNSSRVLYPKHPAVSNNINFAGKTKVICTTRMLLLSLMPTTEYWGTFPHQISAVFFLFFFHRYSTFMYRLSAKYLVTSAKSHNIWRWMRKLPIHRSKFPANLSSYTVRITITQGLFIKIRLCNHIWGSGRNFRLSGTAALVHISLIQR